MSRQQTAMEAFRERGVSRRALQVIVWADDKLTPTKMPLTAAHSHAVVAGHRQQRGAPALPAG